jgi:hypothetical protein
MNKVERSAAELVERRAGTEGNADQPSTYWTQRQISVTQGVETATYCHRYSRWEPYAGKPHLGIWGGRREVTRVPTANGLLAAVQARIKPPCAQHDLTLMTRKSFEIFYARG